MQMKFLHDLAKLNWIRVYDDFSCNKRIIQIKHREIWIKNIIDFDDLIAFIDFANFHKKAMKEIDIYLDIIQ